VVNIVLSNNQQLLFHAGMYMKTSSSHLPFDGVPKISRDRYNRWKSLTFLPLASRPGTVPENDNWIRRKRNVVLRFGFSTWAAHNMFDKGDEDKFKARFQLGEQAGEYAIHGGGFPVRVHAVEGPIAAIVVSGLAQEEDHQVVVECLQILLDEQKQH